jgi:hypothetical protein
VVNSQLVHQKGNGKAVETVNIFSSISLALASADRPRLPPAQVAIGRRQELVSNKAANRVSGLGTFAVPRSFSVGRLGCDCGTWG